MAKLSKEDLFECKFYSSELALLEHQLMLIEQQKKTLNQQRQTIDATEACLDQRQYGVQQQLEQMALKHQKLSEMLVEKYGVEDQKQINWKTGEIRPSELPEEADTTGSDSTSQ